MSAPCPRAAIRSSRAGKQRPVGREPIGNVVGAMAGRLPDVRRKPTHTVSLSRTLASTTGTWPRAFSGATSTTSVFALDRTVTVSTTVEEEGNWEPEAIDGRVW